MVDKVDEKVDILVVDGGLASFLHLGPRSLAPEQLPRGCLPGSGGVVRARAY